jgi:hypothetical protein
MTIIRTATAATHQLGLDVMLEGSNKRGAINGKTNPVGTM